METEQLTLSIPETPTQPPEQAMRQLEDEAIMRIMETRRMVCGRRPRIWLGDYSPKEKPRSE